MEKAKDTKAESIEFNEIRAMVRAEIEKRYGGVAEFLKHRDVKKFGGEKIRCYLYDSGSRNFEVLSKLCGHLGIGKLTREVKVVRSISYMIEREETTEDNATKESKKRVK